MLKPIAKDTQAFAQRMLQDADFRQRVLANPETTIALEGYTVDPAVVNALMGMSAEELEAKVAQVGPVFDRSAAA